MRYVIRHESMCIVNFFIPTNLFLARLILEIHIFVYSREKYNSWDQLVCEHNAFLKIHLEKIKKWQYNKYTLLHRFSGPQRSI